MANIYQINVKPQTPGERGLPKIPVDAARVTLHGLEGDFNRYREEKCGGREDHALLILPLEMIVMLNREGWPIQPGDIGENITSKGIPYDDFSIGSRYQCGEIQFEISEPANPCGNLKLLAYVGQERWPEFRKVMLARRGLYARVLKEGMIKKNDAIIKIV